MKFIKKINKAISKYWRIILIIIVAGLFFVGTSSYNYATQSYSDPEIKELDFVKWASPDASANYIFAKLYAQAGKLTFDEKYNLLVSDIIHPRSIRSDLGVLKPVSFLGIILIYGKIASIFSYKIIPFLTPLFAAIGIIYFYLLIKKLFSRNVAVVATLLLASFPPFIYYTVRSMFHNVLFMVLILIGIYYVYLVAEKREFKVVKLFKYIKLHLDFKGIIYASLAGIFLGLGVITRTSELLWLLPMLVILWVFNIKRIGIIKLLIFLIFILIAVSPALYYNNLLYGSYINGGYPEMNASIHELKSSSVEIAGSTLKLNFLKVKKVGRDIFNTIFHFGFHPRQSLEMLNLYFVRMFYLIFGAALAGLILFLQKFRRLRKKHWLYLLTYFFISGILIIYYGSWLFHDNPNVNSVTIGNSYTRYWLPVYLGALPFASLFILRLTRAVSEFLQLKNGKSAKGKTFWSFYLGKKKLIVGLRVLVIILVVIVSLEFVLVGSEEGLLYAKNKRAGAEAERDRLLELTESNATVITRYHDKLLFPERKVIVGLFDDQSMIGKYAKLVELMPVYYYNFTFPARDIEYLNSRRLVGAGLQIEEIEKVTGDFTLYQLKKTKDPTVISTGAQQGGEIP